MLAQEAKRKYADDFLKASNQHQKRCVSVISAPKQALLKMAPSVIKSSSSDPALQKGKCWIDYAAMAVLAVILMIVLYFL